MSETSGIQEPFELLSDARFEIGGEDQLADIQTVGTRDPRGGDSGNPDSNPDRVSGYGPAASRWRGIPPSTESVVEQAALAWLESIGCSSCHDLEIWGIVSANEVAA